MAGSFDSLGGSTQSSSTSGNFSVTVPSGVDLCVVAVTGYFAGTDASMLDECSFVGASQQDFTWIQNSFYNNSGQQCSSSLYMPSDDANWPSTGAQTFYYSCVDTWDEGANIAVMFFSNIDITGSPIRGTDKRTQGGNWTASIGSVVANDIGLVIGYDYNGNPDANPSGAGQTAIWEPSYFNSAGFAAGYEVGTGAGALQIDAGATELSPQAVVFIGTAGGGGGPSKVIGGGII